TCPTVSSARRFVTRPTCARSCIRRCRRWPAASTTTAPALWTGSSRCPTGAAAPPTSPLKSRTGCATARYRPLSPSSWSTRAPASRLRWLTSGVAAGECRGRAWKLGAAPRPALGRGPVVPLVLYTGAGPWENNRALQDLLGEPAEFHGFVPDWGPLFWELGEH